MFKELSDNYEEWSRNYNRRKKEIETINNNQKEMKNTISEMKKHTRRNYNQAG